TNPNLKSFTQTRTFKLYICALFIIMSKIFQYLRTDSFRKHFIISIIAVALFIFLIFSLLRVYTRHNQQITVPKLTGIGMKDAVKILTNNEFDYQLDSVYQEG